jgi:hypothetical protein
LARAARRANIGAVKHRGRARTTSRWLAASLVAAWLAVALHADSAEAAAARTEKFASRFGEAAFDVMILRTASTAALLAGSAFFIASVPLVLPFEGWRPSFNAFVYAPYEYVVLRPLGDF